MTLSIWGRKWCDGGNFRLEYHEVILQSLLRFIAYFDTLFLKELIMGYQYDIFVSYRHGQINDWLKHIFLPTFKNHLEMAIGREPKIYWDDQIRVGDSWKLNLYKSLALSRCLLSFWHPEYFKSEWCIKEFMIMKHRERIEKYRTMSNPNGLILGILVGDGEYLPKFANQIQYLDCRDYYYSGLAFKETRLFVEFEEKIKKQWAPQIGQAIKKAPEWKKTYLSIPDVKIPDLGNPKMKPPFLG